MSNNTLCSAFLGHRRIASGTLPYVVEQVMDNLGDDAILAVILDNSSSAVIEIDFRGDKAEVLSRLSSQALQLEDPAKVDAAPPKGRGRPKLGVTAREITLLPRHWEWLDQLPGGASVNLRKLVEQAKRSTEDQDHQRKAQTAVYKFLTTVGSDLEDYEESLRALYRNDAKQFEQLVDHWPKDIRAHIRKLARAAFSVNN